jgi:hypothetical protein
MLLTSKKEILLEDKLETKKFGLLQLPIRLGVKWEKIRQTL